MSGHRRLVPPLALLLVGLFAVGIIAWGIVQGAGMFSAGGLNAQTKTQAAAPGAAPAAAGATATAAQPVVLGGVSTHAALSKDCGACHAVPFTAATMGQKCVACHKDVTAQVAARNGLHGKLLASGWDGTTCSGCHVDHRGATGALTALDRSFPHTVTGFALRGAHENMGCSSCHGKDVTTFDTASCIDCHQRLRGDFMTRHIAEFGKQCIACHNGTDRGDRNFDHSTFAFKLTGAHTGLACDRCHQNQGSLAAFKQTPQDCYSCHAKNDAHAGKFGKDCGSCHSTADWKQSTFDHAKTSFPLTGAHATIACDKCHAGGTFTALSTDCVSCHAEPAFHQGAFGSQSTQCGSCHTTQAWTPATYTLAHPAFPLDHGSREQTSTCKTCHATTLSAYTCFGCHRHTPDNVVAEHEGQTAAQLQDCVRCHQNGRGGG